MITDGHLTAGSILAERFEILEHIGNGSIGMVFKAHDSELNETVAIKVLKPEYYSEKAMITRFKREIKLARRINHPNICGIYNYFSFKKLLFISMEFIDGQELELFIRRDLLTLEEKMTIVRGLLSGMAAAHKLDIIHRDLKPANIMIDKSMQPIILDFGIARQSGVSKLTQYDEILGTPLYMAPEYFRGGPADTRSDIYALGIIFYYLFTGELPFVGLTPFEVALQHLEKEPVIPPESLSKIPHSIIRIIMRCLEKTPAQRYQTMSEIMVALEAEDTSQGEPQRHSDPSPFSRQRILIADDDEHFNKLFGSFLQKEGYDVLFAENGALAVNMALEHLPDLICLDIQMPVMDGYDAADFLLANPSTRHIPIMLITSRGESDYRAFSRSLGVVEHISKPFDIEDVLQKIKRQLTSRTMTEFEVKE